MSKHITRQEFLQLIFSGRYDEEKHGELRLRRVRVPGREVCLAQIIGVSERRIYENLGLHIGLHAGEDHTGESIGILHFTPWEATVVAAAMDLDKVKKSTEGMAVVKTILVKNKLVNLIVKPAK